MSSAGSYGGGGSGMAGVLTITGDSGLTVTGNVTLTGLTSGSGISFIGTSTTALQVAIDYLAMADATSDGSKGFLGVLGAGTIIAPWGGIASGNMFIGPSAGNSAITGSQNIGIGQGALGQIQDAANNVAIGGGGTAQGCISYTDNIAIGYQSLSSNGALGGTGLAGNVSIGSNALRNGTGMVFNIAVGYNAGVNYTNAESSNILIGNDGVLAENNTIRIGNDGSGVAEQENCYIAGIYNATGTTGTRFVTIDSDFRLAATASGGGGVTSIAGDAGATATGAVTITGGSSGAVYTESGGNTLTTTFDFLTMADTTSTTGYIDIGGEIVFAMWGGVAQTNLIIGPDAGAPAMSGVDNTACGSGSLNGVTTGSSNTAVGSGSLNSITTAANNVAVGVGALLGLNTGQGGNVAIGASALNGITDGRRNIGIGTVAGNALTATDSDNILIANTGVSGDVNTIRIGTQGTGAGQQNACFIAGIDGVTVTGSAVLCSASGQLGTVPSSRRYKENIHDIGGESRPVMNLRAVKFNYKSDPDKQTQYGLIAEEVKEIMPYLVLHGEDGQPSGIKYHEIPTLLLAELQRLELRVKSLEEQLARRI